MYFAYIPARPGMARGVPGRAVMYAGLDHGCIWGKGCQASLRLTSRRWREEAMRGRCNKHTGRLRLSK